MKRSRFEAALSAVQLGRAILLEHFGKISHVEAKEKQGLVSEADRETELRMKNFLAEACPDISFLGEETAYLEHSQLVSQTQGARWILDPLDGTTNYIHQFPIFCISLALEVDGELQIGIIDVPMLNQTWVAQKGQGAFCNQKRLKVSQTSQFSEALLSTGFFAEEPEYLDEQLQIFSYFVRKARGIRRPGAAAYDLALVGAGVFDLFWEKNLKPWDTAAGQLIVEEAGGIVRTYEGAVHNPFEKSIIAGNSILVEQFLEQMRKIKKSQAPGT